MFLHYLGKQEQEPRKLCFFSYAVYRVSQVKNWKIDNMLDGR